MNFTPSPAVSGDGHRWSLRRRLQYFAKFKLSNRTIIRCLAGASLISLISLQVARASSGASGVAGYYPVGDEATVGDSLAFGNAAGIDTSSVFSTVIDAPSPDYQPLADLYRITNGAGWTNKAGWLSGTDPCTGNGGNPWFGLGCVNGRVTDINLANNQLSGVVPANLSTLTDLQILYLNNNRLSGSIPTELGALSDLVSLALENNQLTGSIPTSFSALINLRYLSIDNNQLTGSIPAILGALNKLQYLSLSNNKLSGTISPDFGALTELQQLSLNHNLLDGSIPASLKALTNLQFLSLANNRLSGGIPAGLVALTKLQYLSLANNLLSGGIPSGLGALTNLQILYLDNNRLNGSIPADFGALTGLQLLSLSDNQLSGGIPVGLGALTNLQYLFLNNNQITGTIPANLGAVTSLVDLLLEGNQLGGDIPASLGALTNLQSLSLSDNRLKGSIPASLGALVNLQTLSLSSNQLSGSIPTSLGVLSDLQYLYLNDNQLSGSIPASLGALTNLLVLSLSDNRLSGSIPASLSVLTGLLDITLYNNQLSGCYPASLSVFCNVPGKDFSNNPGLPGGGSADGFAAFCASGIGSDAFVARATASAPSVCVGGAVSLSVNGNSGYSYAWSGPPSSQFRTTDGREVSVTLTAPGQATFSVTVSSGGGCSSTASVSVAVKALPTPVITGLANSYCKNGGLVMLSAIPTGGQFTVDGLATSQLDPANLAVGSHTVRYTVSVDGCAGTASKTSALTIHPLPTVTPGPEKSLTLGYGGTCTQITATADGGSNPPGGEYTYAWISDGAPRGNLSGQAVTVCPSTTTSYLVRATDARGCTSAPAQVRVSVRDVRCGPGNQFLTVCQYNVSLCVQEKVAEQYLSLGARIGGCAAGDARLPAGAERSDLLQGLSLTARLDPTQNAVTLEVQAPQAGMATFEVFDLTGRTRQSRQEKLTKGINEVELRLDTLPTGMYMIRAGDAFNRQAAVRFGK